MTTQTVKPLATKILNLVEIAGCPVKGRDVQKHLGITQHDYLAAIEYLSERKLIGRIRGIGAAIFPE